MIPFTPFSPLTSFCSRLADVANSAFILSLPDLPEGLGNREDLYLEACSRLNSFFDNGEIDDAFYDYLCMHLDYAFAHGGRP